jgi:hypothetical protein
MEYVKSFAGVEMFVTVRKAKRGQDNRMLRIYRIKI